MPIFKALTYVNISLIILMTAAYSYQLVYTVVGLIHRRVKPEPEPSALHRFAALVCARNEAAVIGELVESLKRQTYPSELFDIYVLADNCTDDTARRAADAGAAVYVRRNSIDVGKGYALDYLLKRIKTEHSDAGYDGYVIFDADNIVDPNFITEMNKTFDRGFDAITCYRNSKNFGTNWITAGYSIWFLREARFLNYPRMLLGNSCAVSGTGFLVSDRLITENGGWPFNLLTEDIQFSVNCIIAGHRIGYCDSAIIYDEQPETLKQSWNQRMRWAKGFYQVDAKYLTRLLSGMLRSKGGNRKMSCYDMFFTVAPGMLFTLAVFIFNLSILFCFVTLPHAAAAMAAVRSLHFLTFTAINFYIGMVGYGALTVISEWPRIQTTSLRKIEYIWSFPLFMATYLPISVIALKRHVEWAPITHYAVGDLAVSDFGKRD